MPDHQPLPLPSIVRRSIVELLRNVCYEKTMLLVAEDVHWLDELSASGLVDIVRSTTDGETVSHRDSADRFRASRLYEVITSGMHVRTLPPLSDESAQRLTALICADMGTTCEARAE